MANLSNINNVLRVSSNLRVGINTDAASYALEIGGTNSGIKLKNSGGSGKVYSILSDTSGNFQIYDDAAASGRLVINDIGNATFAGNVTLQKSIQLPTTTTGGGTPSDVGVLSFGGNYTTGNRLFVDSSGLTFRIQGSANLILEAPNHNIKNILDPLMPDRTQWFNDLAQAHWTIEQSQAGDIYKHFEQYLPT